ncbi:hypothetical protein EB077_14740, partial [bacterium]|nr:hypothetical protein [bacterium]
MAKKKKYSKRTKDAARQYGKTQGWKKLSQKRIQFFLDSVFRAKGFLNIQAIESFSGSYKAKYDIEQRKYFEAAKVFGSKAGWEIVTEKRFKDFLNVYENYCRANNIKRLSPDDAMDFALQYEFDEISDDEIDELSSDDFDVGSDMPIFTDTYQEPFVIVEGQAGWNEPDALDDRLSEPNVLEIELIDFDGTIVYSGNDRRDFWDSMRELSDGIRYPIYDATYIQNDDGQIFI